MDSQLEWKAILNRCKFMRVWVCEAYKQTKTRVEVTPVRSISSYGSALTLSVLNPSFQTGCMAGKGLMRL